MLGEPLVEAFATKSGQGWVGTIVAADARPTTSCVAQIANKQINGFLAAAEGRADRRRDRLPGDNATNQIVQVDDAADRQHA